MPGRNDPCHCGSGQKYKKCCLFKDREAEREARTSRQAPALPPPIMPDRAAEAAELLTELDDETKSVLKNMEAESDNDYQVDDPLTDRMMVFWDSFTGAEYDDQWQLLSDMLNEEPELCDEEALFETASVLFDQAVRLGEGGRFVQLLDQFATAAPEAYEAELAYILQWRVELALLEQDRNNLRRAFLNFSQIAGDHLDQYYSALNGMTYHGELDIMLEGMRLARLLVAESDKLVPGANEEFDNWLIRYEILQMVESNPAITAADLELNERLAAYGVTIAAEGMDERLNYLTGRQLPAWTTEDFRRVTITQRNKSRPTDKFSRLCDAFLHYAHVAEGVSWAKAQMAREELAKYFFKRERGELEPERPPKARRKGKKPQFQSNLSPNHATLDRFIPSFFYGISFRFYEASAFFELIPVWLRFLVKYDLLEEEAIQESIRSLSALHGSLLKMAREQVADPLPAQNLENWG